MNITLLTVGKTDVPWVAEGMEVYASRLKHYAPFAVKELPHLKGVSSLSPAEVKSRESELILKALRPSDQVIILDEKGRSFRSVEFASFLEGKMARSSSDLVFVVGGAFGFSDAVRSRADGMISLSPMTFSHQMVRVIFLEQLYRAFTILGGHPYHNE
ncbi:MAG: 23S rRNA (pseudouridine(1915)-N(3))-methyltransferase RlmH [Bacteroidales bacterium]|nr:23S rRNA (pseudouridine(1915)-N(3))-methyltransferase RlmH [Bacteroidales bacterium]